ncbi:sodium-independent anion transporter [Ornithinibacillus sp. L9]|uniref:Sodium-independent anion transporter n=1 Tax=Ornithinibacillus caprae TaxID=2678566 RepID=A0A6N8FHS2_9BACI|nr:SulP family inorganic anion transporter [Ornithinibacillus caprae]MUK87607.1 sodium-independent anion transporter [Ornithinibacillus caprae]
MIDKLFPGLRHLTSYNSSKLSSDITAGVIVTFLLIPQSMAYAIIAGVPLTMGILAGTFPLIIYTLFGSSRYLSIGPVSIVSLLAFTGISSITDPGSNRFLELIILLSLLVGMVQLLLGLLKFGSFLNYISPAVIGGFTSALAIIIILNQMSSIIGVALPKYNNFITYFWGIFERISNVNIVTITIGLASLLFLVVLKNILHMLSGPFLLIFISIIVVDYFDLNNKGVEVVGGIPRKLPDVSLTIPTLDILLSLIPIALVIGFISFFESFSVAKTLADKEGEKVNPNQELIGLSFANITSSFVGSIPVAGAISRTAVNYESGAKTNVSMLVTALLMLLAVLFMTPLFYYLPKATLSAIIIFAVMKLINAKQLVYYLKRKPIEAFIFLVTFISTLILDVFIGLVIGVVASLGICRLTKVDK